MTRYVNYHWFKIAALSLVIAEALSLWAYTLAWLNWLLLPLIILAVIWLVTCDRRWALYLPLAELVWGSLGKSFYWNFSGTEISIRLLLFVVIFLVSLPAIFRSRKKIHWQQPLLRLYIAVIFFIALALLIGWLQHNPLSNIFFDANGYLYLGYWLVWLDIIPTIDWRRVASLGLAATLIVSLKALTIFHIFAHAYSWANIAYLYLWVRDTKVGELTFVTGNVWRIFFQSQIYVVIAWLLAVMCLLLDRLARVTKKNWLLIGILGAAILISLSRSFGLALVLTFVITVLTVIRQLQLSRKKIILLGCSLIGSISLTLGLLFIPPVNADVAAAFAKRLSGGEEAASSRRNLLPVLVKGIEQNWLTGAGFGTKLTYINKDPRIKNLANPDGTYSTYAFELGWLDFAFKFGILGWLVWVGLILYILYQGWKRGLARDNIPLLLTVSGLLFISITHALTPYLNHPLGLGYLMLIWLYLYHDKTQSSH
ncbi:MAG: O-antigen ligase family protein [Candidatus Komeilibacteria bacterium]